MHEAEEENLSGQKKTRRLCGSYNCKSRGWGKMTGKAGNRTLQLFAHVGLAFPGPMSLL